MKFIEYQKMARRTQNTKLTKTDKLYHSLLGMCSEVGEIMLAVNVNERLKEIGDLCWFIAEFCDMMEFDMNSLHRGFYSALDVTDGEGIEYLASGVGIIHGIFQKSLQGHYVDETRIKEELHCLIEQMGRLCKFYGSTLEDVMARNIAKLKKRYPEGFDVEHSVNRGAES